jgi:hypothetical protein
MDLTDADRQAAVAALRTHAGAGHIDLDAFGDRTAVVLAAATSADLDSSFADLPGGVPILPSAVPVVPVAVRPARPTPAIVTRLAPVVPLALLFVAIWALTGFGSFWPVWPILGVSLATLKRSRTCGRSPHWV